MNEKNINDYTCHTSWGFCHRSISFRVWSFLYCLWKYTLNIFSYKGKHRVSKEIQDECGNSLVFVHCWSLQNTVNCVIIKQSDVTDKFKRRKKATHEFAFFSSYIIPDMHTYLTYNKSPFRCRVPQPHWYQQSPTAEICWECSPWLQEDLGQHREYELEASDQMHSPGRKPLKWDCLSSCSWKVGAEFTSPQVFLLHLVKICILPRWLYMKPN